MFSVLSGRRCYGSRMMNFNLQELQIPAEPEALSAVAMEMIGGLGWLAFEGGVSVQHRRLLKLRTRRRDLMAHACAHAAFYCQLLLRARQAVPVVSSQGFHVGVIGAGHLGKQLIRCLLDLTDLQGDDISASTRRPETLRELRDRGVRCFYDNVRLVRESQTVFLCCLPSQLPAVCAEIGGHLPVWCAVYSLVSAVPLARVTTLLGHCGVIRPEYRCDPRDDDGPQCHQHTNLTEALKDGSLVRATIPGGAPDGGGVRIVSRFIEPAVYSVLNLCTSHDLSHDQAVGVLNSLLHQQVTWEDREGGFTSSSFVNKDFAASLPADGRFPRFDLSRVQMTETPLTRHLADSSHLRGRLTALYCSMFRVDTRPAHVS